MKLIVLVATIRQLGTICNEVSTLCFFFFFFFLLFLNPYVPAGGFYIITVAANNNFRLCRTTGVLFWFTLWLILVERCSFRLMCCRWIACSRIAGDSWYKCGSASQWQWHFSIAPIGVFFVKLGFCLISYIQERQCQTQLEFIIELPPFYIARIAGHECWITQQFTSYAHLV